MKVSLPSVTVSVPALVKAGAVPEAASPPVLFCSVKLAPLWLLIVPLAVADVSGRPSSSRFPN